MNHRPNQSLWTFKISELCSILYHTFDSNYSKCYNTRVKDRREVNIYVKALGPHILILKYNYDFDILWKEIVSE